MIRLCTLLVGMALLMGATEARERVSAPDPIAWADSQDRALERRLAQLDPDEPMMYFELAEEVVSSFAGEGYRLARQLYALAYALDARSGDRLDLAPSTALALAEITPDAQERRWLLTMARTLTRANAGRVDEIEVPRERLLCAEILSIHRGGEFQRLRPMLRRVELEETLRGVGMERSDAQRLVAMVENSAENQRDEPRTDPRSRSDDALSPHPSNGGNPGPTLSAEEFALSLRAELLLVGGEPGSWGADLVTHDGAPARDLDPGELLSITGVSADRPVWRAGAEGWRDGAWVAR